MLQSAPTSKHGERQRQSCRLSGRVQLGGFANCVSTLYDTNFLDANGNPFALDGQTTFNLYGQHRLKTGLLHETQFRLGARNLFDKQPPITADGYLGAVYNPYGRYVYASISQRF